MKISLFLYTHIHTYIKKKFMPLFFWVIIGREKMLLNDRDTQWPMIWCDDLPQWVHFTFETLVLACQLRNFMAKLTYQSLVSLYCLSFTMHGRLLDIDHQYSSTSNNVFQNPHHSYPRCFTKLVSISFSIFRNACTSILHHYHSYMQFRV